MILNSRVGESEKLKLVCTIVILRAELVLDKLKISVRHALLMLLNNKENVYVTQVCLLINLLPLPKKTSFLHSVLFHVPKMLTLFQLIKNVLDALK
jgi:hypothetical protein